MATHLKLLLQQRHLQAHPAFCREYDRVSHKIDPSLVGSGPSRATLHRWMTGTLRSQPYPDHCRVLEAMFPGWTAERLLQGCDDPAAGDHHDVAGLLDAVRAGLSQSEPGPGDWGRESTSATGVDLMPPSLSARIAQQPEDLAPDLGRRLLAVQRRLRLSDDELRRLAGLAGHPVDLVLGVDIAIEATGDAVVTYSHEILNLGPMPLRRIARELWFEHPSGPKLKITPIFVDGRRFLIQRTHDTEQLAKFACQFSPAVEPGGIAKFGYSCLGGRFLEDFYWRQDIHRPTRHATISIRQRHAALVRCSAVEDHPDGSETFATDDILWDHEGPDVTMTLTRDYLVAGQALTLRWEIDREPAPTR